MTDVEIIESMEVPGWPQVFVVGSFGTRITFYSQQVRALSLVDALVSMDRLKGRWKFAVVGAGAAGLAASAALALLVPNAQVHLYEREGRALHLQDGCRRRNLRPHIYDWPKAGALDAAANLPILDWRAGSADAVARAVVQAFESIWTTLRQPEPRMLHTVTSVVPAGADYRVTYQEAGAEAPASEAYHSVFLTIGFGHERRLQGAHWSSYWSDAGVPDAPKAGREHTTLVVSGAGDGGLIDLAAAALEDFDHEGLIRLVTTYPGIDEITQELLDIDHEAQRHGLGYDFIGSYDARIGPRLRETGLVAAVAQRLRPRLTLVFNTERTEMLQAPTATLNRLVAYLVLRAGERDGGSLIQHRPGRLVPGDPAKPGEYNIGGMVVRADDIVVRHGAATREAFSHFPGIAAAYEPAHQQWLAADPARGLPPSLTDQARHRLEQALDLHDVPVARAAYLAVAASAPSKVRIEVDPLCGTLMWGGAVECTRLQEWWSEPSAALVIEVASSPTALGPLASAIGRLLVHGRLVRLETDDLAWTDWLVKVTERSEDALALTRPIIGSRRAAALTTTRLILDATAEGLHSDLDVWILQAVSEHLRIFLTVGTEPANRINWRIEPDLRTHMAELWTRWEAVLRGDPVLLRRVLCLAACAVEDDLGNAGERLVPIGPLKLSNLLSTISLALAVAVAWQGGAPRAHAPGNFDRRDAQDEPVATVHACGAELIRGALLGLAAADHDWRTDYVLISQLFRPISFERQATASLRDVARRQPRLDEISPARKVIIGADLEFLRALAAGVDSLVRHLRSTEARLREEWAAQIDAGENTA